MITKKENDGRRLGKLPAELRRLAKAIRDTVKPVKKTIRENQEIPAGWKEWK